MKKTTALLVLAAFAIAGALLLGRSTDSSAAARPSRSYAAAASDDSLQEQVVAAERAGLDALKKGDIAGFGNLTADEAVLVDDHGPATKAQVLQNVASFSLIDYSMENVHFVPISPNTGLISYRITEKGSSHGHEFSAQAYVSSVWTRRGNSWLCLFSQETAVRKPAPAGANQ